MAAMWGRMMGRGGRSQHYDAGIRLFDQGMYEQAIDSFKHALDEPKGGALVERLARFYLAESHSALALSQMNQSANDRAIDNLEKAIALSPNYADLHYHLACAYSKRGRTSEAIAPLRRALEINPNYSRATLQLGITLYTLGQHADGLRYAARALALDPMLNRSLMEGIRSASEVSNHKEALQLLEQMNQADDNDAMFHARLALDLYRRGMLHEAAAEYRQALAIAPGYADLRNQLGITLHAVGQDEEAVGEFRRAVEINPRYVEAHINLGVSLEKTGQRDEARHAYERAHQLDPDNTAVSEALAALTLTALPNPL